MMTQPSKEWKPSQKVPGHDESLKGRYFQKWRRNNKVVQDDLYAEYDVCLSDGVSVHSLLLALPRHTHDSVVCSCVFLDPTFLSLVHSENKVSHSLNWMSLESFLQSFFKQVGHYRCLRENQWYRAVVGMFRLATIYTREEGYTPCLVYINYVWLIKIDISSWRIKCFTIMCCFKGKWLKKEMSTNKFK